VEEPVRKITIRFSTDKNGKRRAHYWGRALRWLPISVAEAERKLIANEANWHDLAAGESK
jgi:hypothetical protein